MAPSSYRLDTLAALLVARLEATRRAHLEDPAAATEAIARKTRELVAAQAAECRATMGDEAQARRIEREGVETFLPRYTRVALRQNAVEAKGFGVIFPDHLLGRVGSTVLLFLVALFAMRAWPNPFELLWFLLPVSAPFLPELRAWSARRRYQAELQELTDDLARLEEAEDRLAPVLGAVPSGVAPPAGAAAAEADPVPPAGGGAEGPEGKRKAGASARAAARPAGSGGAGG